MHDHTRPHQRPAPILGNAGQQTINLTGISAGPFESQAITITAKSSNPSLISDRTVSYTSPSATGSLSYAPLVDQTGSAVITITLKDAGGTAIGGVDTVTRTFTVQVNSSTFVNHAPSFAKGLDQNTTDDGGVVNIPGWATSISTGSPDEAAKGSTSSSSRTTMLCCCQAGHRRLGEPDFQAGSQRGYVAHVSVRLHDNGGTANGGADSSDAQTFSITITKPRPWHNTAEPLDVTGDTFIAANDALAIINYINAFDAGEVPPTAPLVPSYLDVNNDRFISASDALAVINFINAHPIGQGEAVAAMNSQAADGLLQQFDALFRFGSDTTAQSRRRVP